MNKQVILGRHMKYAIALFLVGSSIIGGTAADAGNDSWIAIGIGTVAVLPLLLVFGAILRLYPGENLYEIAMHVFGRVGGTVVTVIYIIYSLHLGALVLNIFAEFVHAMNLPDTPKLIIDWFVIIPCVFAIYRGASVFGRIARFLYPVLVFTVALTVLLSFKDMDFDNLQPILGTPFSAMFLASLTVFTLPAGESVLFTSFPLGPGENYRKVFITGIILGMSLILLANLRNLLVIGTSGIELFPYSSYQTVSIIAIGEFFTRIELIIGINLMICGFFKVASCAFSAAIGFGVIFRTSEYKYFAVPVCLLIITLAQIMFENSTESLEFIKAYKYYVLGYQVLLPAAILITGTIKKHRQQAAQTPSSVEEEPAAP